MLNYARPKRLVLDRTNWKLGQRDVNVLVLALVARRFWVPLFWTLLPHQGSSDAGHRIALVQRYLDLFEAGSVELSLAHREFMGADWPEFLFENNAPFAIRIKECMTARRDPSPRSCGGTGAGPGWERWWDAHRPALRGSEIARRRGSDHRHKHP